ncbi:MAG TPA: DUF6282 family protein [Bacillus sp. (in: firmicutes)]|nr:DUF6282 family protein [Bacillus sp. (in: firmicutes)]
MNEELLEGAYDLHVHTGPDISPRKIDDIEYADRLVKIGMKGFGIKSHYFCTAERARIVNKLNPNINAIGAIALNNSVGGINPFAVEMAARDGAKIVWMPTLDSDNEVQFLFNNSSYERLPPWAKLQLERQKEGKPIASISILEGNGLKPVVHEILDLIREYNLILATGHLSKTEIFLLASACKENNIKKFVITHPTFPSTVLTKQEQKELTELGAIIEHCYSVIKPKFKMTWEELYEQILFVGPNHIILSSDTGQVDNPYPDECLQEFVTKLLNNGFTKEQIKRMTVENTSFLVES